MNRHQTRIEAAFLFHCAPQQAYDWLKERAHKEGPVSVFASDDVSNVLEWILLRRKDPLIDLGVSRFGNYPSAIRKAYLRGNTGVRCAALSNANVGANDFRIFSRGWLDKKLLLVVIESGTEAELEALCSNGYLEEDALGDLLERKGHFSKLADDRYLSALVWLGSNPRLSKKYDETILDGWAEHSYHKVFTKAWELTRTLPADKLHAAVLEKLLQKTRAPIGLEKVEEILERWRFDEEEDEYSATLWLRSRIGDLLKADDTLLQSSDPALRASFFRRFSPYTYSNWPELIAADPKRYDDLVENNALWRTEELRSQLSRAAWDVPDPGSHMDAPNTFRAVEVRKRREFPVWFRDEDEEYSDEPGAVLRRVEKKLEAFASSMDVDVDRSDQKQTLSRIEDRFFDLKSILANARPSVDIGPVQEDLQEILQLLRGMNSPQPSVEATPVARRKEPLIKPAWIYFGVAVLAVIVFLLNR